MQQIERYGVIALVFLLVTIVAVSFWGDNKSPGFWSRLTGRGAKKEATSTQMADATTPPGSTAERAIQSDLPMSPAGSPAANSTSLVTPIETAPQAIVAPAPTPMAQNSLAAGRGTPAPTSVAQAPMTPIQSSSPEPVHAPRAVPAAAPSAGSSEYVVQKGDSLMLIASRTLGSKSRWTEIRDMNPRVDPKSLKVGTKLSIPASASAAKSGAPAGVPVHKSATAPASKNPSGSTGGSTGTYVVRKGDTMKSIAEHALGDSARWKEIATSNPKLDPHHLSVGTNLRMPSGRTAEPLVASTMTSDLSNRPHVR